MADDPGGAEASPVGILGNLPDHLAWQVLHHLDHRDCAAAAGVCSRWRQLAADETVWQAGYARSFPAWGAERTLDPASQQAADALSWGGRYRWRLGLQRAWAAGQRRLAHALDAHHAWVNAVRLVPGAGLASGGSEGAVNVWSLDGQLQHHDCTHSQAVWALDASPDLVASGSMDGWLQLLDLGSGAVTARLPVGWRGPAGQPPDAADWQLFDVITSVQLLPDSCLVLAGTMDGQLSLLDPRCPNGGGSGSSGAVATTWGAALAGGGEAPRFWWRARSAARLCAARCHGHVLAAGGDAPAVSLHDLRMGGARYAELALPPGGHPYRTPSVFALDMLWPRLAAGGDRGQLQVWDISRLSATGAEEPASGSSTPRQQQAALPPVQRGWPSPGGCRPHVPGSSSGSRARSAAAASLDCLLASNDHVLQRPDGSGLQMGCVYSIKLLPDGCLLSADHTGWVRSWQAERGCASAAGPWPRLQLGAEFAPSLEDPASALVDVQSGAPFPVGMHCLDACLTHLAVAGRDSVVRLYSYEAGGSGEGGAEPGGPV